MSVILETKQLCKFYGAGENQVKAVNQVDIQIERGEFVAIVGKSGSGKSTLLHMLGAVSYTHLIFKQIIVLAASEFEIMSKALCSAKGVKTKRIGDISETILGAVSYTHLDVYKRQYISCCKTGQICKKCITGK